MNYLNTKNTMAIKVKFLGPTNYKGARIKLIDTYSNTTTSKTFSYCYKTGDILQQAIDILMFNNANIISTSNTKEYYIICIENWGDEFININELKNLK
jgi:hypothetical protein